MIRSLIGKIKPFLWLVPGFLLFAAFPPMAQCQDVMVALAPLLWLARNGTTRESVVRWFWNGFLFWFATLAWMPAIVKNGGPWPLVVLGWGALAFYCALYFAAFGYLSSKVWQLVKGRHYAWRLAALLVAEPVLWAGLEIIRSRLLGGFAWNQLGVVAVNVGLGAPASIGGVYLLSCFVILINGTFASIVERMMNRDPSVSRAVRPLETILPMMVVFGLSFLGSSLGKYAEKLDGASQEGQKVLSVALVQRNFPCVFDRGRDENPVEVYSNLLMNVSHLRPDLVVLPESALCEVGSIGRGKDGAFAKWVCESAGARGVIAGGARYSYDKEYNSAALYQKDSVQVYNKVHLVPFGEYIPGDKLITALQKLAPVGSCTPGELKLLDFEGIKLGVAICYEDTDSAQMRRLAAMGAEALVFVTNDSWFSYSDETIQHAWQSVARAIETGLPVIRVGNSGVTGTVTPEGKATWLRDAGGAPLVDASGSMFDKVVCGGSNTVYVRFGDAPIFILFLLLITTICLVKYYHEHQERRKVSV